jgi:hypothetical protein
VRLIPERALAAPLSFPFAVFAAMRAASPEFSGFV